MKLCLRSVWFEMVFWCAAPRAGLSSELRKKLWATRMPSTRYPPLRTWDMFPRFDVRSGPCTAKGMDWSISIKSQQCSEPLTILGNKETISKYAIPFRKPQPLSAPSKFQAHDQQSAKTTPLRHLWSPAPRHTQAGHPSKRSPSTSLALANKMRSIISNHSAQVHKCPSCGYTAGLKSGDPKWFRDVTISEGQWQCSSDPQFWLQTSTLCHSAASRTTGLDVGAGGLNQTSNSCKLQRKKYANDHHDFMILSSASSFFRLRIPDFFWASDESPIRDCRCTRRFHARTGNGPLGCFFRWNGL